MSEAATYRATLLTVDDEQNICRALKRTLRKLKLNVLIANSGAEGLELLLENHVDIVISDMMMPEMTGAQFLAHVARDYPHTKRILLTGYSDIESTVSAINEGRIATYLTKPWDDNRLLEVIDDFAEQVGTRNEKLRLERLIAVQNDQLQKMNGELEERVAKRTQALNDSHELLQGAIDELHESHNTMVGLLASLVELRDPKDSVDNAKKKALALAMAQELALDDDATAALGHAVDLHRIGCMALDDDTLQTPIRAMSTEQRAKHDQHPLLAEALLMGVVKLNPSAAIIRDQHEQVSGAGYPNQKVGTAISTEAQILAVARDYYDLIAGRLETQPYSPPLAAGHIEDAAGERYDADVVRAFTTVLPDIQGAVAEVRELLVEARLLQPGMLLARELMTPSGVMMLPRGHRLNDAVINKIIKLEETVERSLPVYIKAPDAN